MMDLSSKLLLGFRRLVAVSLGLWLLHACCLPCAAFDNTPVVIIRVDDCRVDDPMTSWRQPRAALGGKSPYQYAKDRAIPIVWAIIASWPAANLCLSWAELESYLAVCGGEVASHSLTHGNPQTESEARYEITQSKAVIESNLPGRSCQTFVQPGVWTVFGLDRFYKLEQPVGQCLRSTYTQTRAYLGGGWIVGSTPYRYGLFAHEPG